MNAMKRCLSLALLAVVALVSGEAGAAVRTRAVRNPFWPVGYQGRRQEISDGEAVKPKAQAAAAEKSEAEAAAGGTRADEPMAVDEEQWSRALAVLRPGGVVSMCEEGGETRQVGTINGRPYSVGDCVTVRLEGKLYNWMVSSFDEAGRVSLERLGVRNEEKRKESAK